MNKMQKYFEYTTGILGATTALSGTVYFYYNLIAKNNNALQQPEAGMAIFEIAFSTALSPIIGYWLGSNLAHGIGSVISNIHNKCFPKNANDINNIVNENTSLLANEPKQHSYLPI